MWAPLQAADVAIYAGSAEVPSQSDADRSAGLRAAFRSALVKASGERRLQSDPAIAAYDANIASLAERYSYREQVQTASDGSSRTRLMLDVDFDPQSVDNALRALGYPQWGRERPTVLVWLVIDNQGNKQIASAFQRSALTPLLDTAALRGLPLQLPRMDGIDLGRVNPITLWDAPVAAVVSASQRYNARVILVARLQKQTSGWTARYTLIDGMEAQQWEARDGFSGGLLELAAHGAADRVAQRYALSSSGPARGVVTVWVDQVQTATDFARVLDYLGKLSAVRDLKPQAATYGRLQLSMDVTVGTARLRQLLSQDGVLTMPPGENLDLILRH